MAVRDTTGFLDFRNPVRLQGLAELLAGAMVGTFVAYRGLALWPAAQAFYQSATAAPDRFLDDQSNQRMLVAYLTLATVVVPWGLWALTRLRTGLPRLLTYGMSRTVNPIGGTTADDGADLGAVGTLKAMLDRAVLPARGGLRGILGSLLSALFPPLQSLTIPQRWVMQSTCRAAVLVLWVGLIAAPAIPAARTFAGYPPAPSDLYPFPSWLIAVAGVYFLALLLASCTLSGRMGADSLKREEELADLGDPLDVHRRLQAAVKELGGDGTPLVSRKPSLGRMQIGQRDEFTGEILYEAGPFRAGRSVPRSALLLTAGGLILTGLGAWIGLKQPFGPPADWPRLGLFGLPWLSIDLALLCGWRLLYLGRRVHSVRRFVSDVWRVELDGTVRVGEVGKSGADGGAKINDSRSRCEVKLQASRIVTEQEGDGGVRLLIRGEVDPALRRRFDLLGQFLQTLRDEDATLPNFAALLRTGGSIAPAADGETNALPRRRVDARALPDAGE